MKKFITYGTNNFKKHTRFAWIMAKLFGKFDSLTIYGPDDIDINFYSKNKNILQRKEGAGFWLWKPYIIHKALHESKDGDYIFYADAASFFIKDVDLIIKELEVFNQDIMAFELPLIEKQWTKKELFISMNLNDNKYLLSNHISASFILIKKSKASEAFIEEYLKLSSIEENITNYFELNIIQDQDFIANRNDQSIFSLLYKKYNLQPFKDPSQYGKYPERYAGKNDLIYTFGEMYKLDNKRIFRLNKNEQKYKTVILHTRKGSIIRYILSHVYNELKQYIK